MKNVETTLCSTYERWAAFEAAMGGGGGTDEEAGSSGLMRRPLVLLGGCGLSHGAAAAPQARCAHCIVACNLSVPQLVNDARFQLLSRKLGLRSTAVQ